MKLPRMACRKGAVRIGGDANTTKTPFKASKTPINTSCHCGKRMSSFCVMKLNTCSPFRVFATSWSTIKTAVIDPKITTNDIDAKLRTKKGSIVGIYDEAEPLLLLLLLFSAEMLVQFGSPSEPVAPVQRGRDTF